jgi:hypothetical protein
VRPGRKVYNDNKSKKMAIDGKLGLEQVEYGKLGLGGS